MTSVYFVKFGEWYFTMTRPTIQKLSDWIDKNDAIYDEYHNGDLDSYLIARNITDFQSRKFENFANDYTVVTRELVLDHYYYDGGEYRPSATVDFRVKEHLSDMVLDELEKSKWNPRSVLGKLEFDRRAEEDGIKYFD
tara:strand:- start:219 stop:632 length:414 start_codon:yes stop_codon:yes gene_type:complete